MSVVIHGCSIGREFRDREHQRLVHIPTVYITRVHNIRKLRAKYHPRGLRIVLPPVKCDFDLPEEITIEILKLLSTESLIACKCVSKKLKNLINSSEFMETFSGFKFTACFRTETKVYGLFTSTRHVDDNSSQPPGFILNQMLTNIIDVLPGSLTNKIVCVKANESGAYFVFLDPLTRKAHIVEDCPLRRYWRSWLGYGYHRKIIVVCSVNLLFVYSFRKRSWKSVIGFYGGIKGYAYAFNGALHWVLSREDEVLIGALDLHSYRLREMELPYVLYAPGSVGELDGDLCYYVGDRNSYGLWVMKEYGDGESWSMIFSFSVSHLHVHRLTPTMLYRCGDGTRLVLFANQLIEKFGLFKYDMDKKEIGKAETKCEWMKRSIRLGLEREVKMLTRST